MANESDLQRNAWQELRRHTPARIALGRVGASLPTEEVLRFSMAQAAARDAVHLALNADRLTSELEQAGLSSVQVHSQAANRQQYLLRPDLGRRLHPDCRAALACESAPPAQRLTIVVADGLSALAAQRHGLPLLLALCERLDGFVLDTVVLATQARVALADEIGALRGAEAVAILLGERPGLSSPDSLGVYMTWAPRPGRSDAERNCISNVRAGGLSYAEAAYKLQYLLHRARTAGAGGVAIKDDSERTAPAVLP